MYQIYKIHPFREFSSELGLVEDDMPRGNLRFDEYGNLEILSNIRRGQSLRTTLDAIRENSDGLLEWDVLHGIPVIYMPGVNSPLERIVTLNLNNVSVWDAIKEVGKQINAQHDVRPVRVYGFNSIMKQDPDRFDVLGPTIWGHGPPEWYVEPGWVTMHLDSVTAREALCAIMHVSPKPIVMWFSYNNKDESDYDVLSINFFWKQYEPGPAIYDEDRLEWLREEYEASGMDPNEAVLPVQRAPRPAGVPSVSPARYR